MTIKTTLYREHNIPDANLRELARQQFGKRFGTPEVGTVMSAIVADGGVDVTVALDDGDEAQEFVRKLRVMQEQNVLTHYEIVED